MAYSVAIAQVTILPSFQRLKKQGYCSSIIMSQIWSLTVAQDEAKIAAAANGQQGIPIVYLSLMKDDVI